ncbi:putative methyltransferase [Streptomyces sp. ADI96-02]|uniref:class I SAM-dependent methyltransferase n=1 Tax=Streptomyces sp. ADI96-02 TaxID=1522760 RepID=UPI000F5588BB|nr:class I SAM-dependent methyltransferase [Streptomyces sp. ADI96-02]RPK63407.1 putative methyltransferase [Streptomyces sp. ADI96-02]
MIDYDAEAEGYDASRGGEARAAATAEAVERLLPKGTSSLVDVACGTGIVTRRLARLERTVLGVDRSRGMAALASPRLPRGVVLGDATHLPIKSAEAEAVVLIWLLHLLDDAAPVIAECARVLRAGGVLVTTVDKDEAAFAVQSDVAALTASLRHKHTALASDRLERVVTLAASRGLSMVGDTTFAGIGQGWSPRQWREQIAGGQVSWCREADPAQVAKLCRALSSLSGQDAPRPDPLYRLIALSS